MLAKFVADYKWKVKSAFSKGCDKIATKGRPSFVKICQVITKNDVI